MNAYLILNLVRKVITGEFVKTFKSGIAAQIVLLSLVLAYQAFTTNGPEETDIKSSPERSSTSLCQGISLPTKISVKALPPKSQYKKGIYDDQTNLVIAYINQNSATAQFEIYDLNNKLVLTGKVKRSSDSEAIELFNCQNLKIGSIKRDNEKSFLSADVSYDIRDDKGNLIFVSERRDESIPLISLIDKDKSELASLTVKRTEKKFQASLNHSTSGENALMLLATLKMYEDAR